MQAALSGLQCKRSRTTANDLPEPRPLNLAHIITPRNGDVFGNSARGPRPICRHCAPACPIARKVGMTELPRVDIASDHFKSINMDKALPPSRGFEAYLLQRAPTRRMRW